MWCSGTGLLWSTEGTWSSRKDKYFQFTTTDCMVHRVFEVYSTSLKQMPIHHSIDLKYKLTYILGKLLTVDVSIGANFWKFLGRTHIYVYTMQGNSGKSSLARATFKNKATGVRARSTKALKCELWATVSVTAQDIPPTRCFPQLMLCLLLKDTFPSTEVTKKRKMQRYLVLRKAQ